jgi:hypothetical protein
MNRSRSLWALLGAFWFVTACGASDANSAAKRALDQWIETFNAGDPQRWERFNADHSPPGAPPRNPGPDLALRATTGGLDLFELKEATATRAVALLRERDGEGSALQVTVEVAAAEPNHIVRLEMQPGRVPVAVQRLDEAQLVKVVRADIEKRVAADRFAGAVLIAKGERTVFSHAFGEADRAGHVPNTTDTRFVIGSMNKMFTAVAVLKLVQEGRIDLQAPGLRRSVRPARPVLRAGKSMGIQQLRVRPAGPCDRAGQWPELLRLRA